MLCPEECRDVNLLPMEMKPVYVKNHQSRMNRGGDKYSIVGYICPGCKRMIYTGGV